MKYIKKFNESQKNQMQIHDICGRYGIENYSLTGDTGLDIYGMSYYVRKSLMNKIEKYYEFV